MNFPKMTRPHAQLRADLIYRSDEALEAKKRRDVEFMKQFCKPASGKTPASTSTDSTPVRASGDGIRVNRDATPFELARAAGLDHEAAQHAADAGLSAVEVLEAGARAEAAAAWDDVVQQFGAQPAAARKHDDADSCNESDAWASVVASFGGKP